MMQLLRVGDRVMFDDVEHQVAALSGTWLRLVAVADGASSAVLLTHLISSPGFKVLDADEQPAPLAGQVLDDLPPEAAAQAREWERHVVEVETGLPIGAAPDSEPRSEFDPQRRTIREREAAKAAELTAAGRPTSAITVQRMRHRYRAEGLRGLVDGRSRRQSSRTDGPTIESSMRSERHWPAR